MKNNIKKETHLYKVIYYIGGEISPGLLARAENANEAVKKVHKNLEKSFNKELKLKEVSRVVKWN